VGERKPSCTICCGFQENFSKKLQPSYSQIKSMGFARNHWGKTTYSPR
jgi:hypothetical protein